MSRFPRTMNHYTLLSRRTMLHTPGEIALANLDQYSTFLSAATQLEIHVVAFDRTEETDAGIGYLKAKLYVSVEDYMAHHWIGPWIKIFIWVWMISWLIIGLALG